MLISEIESKNVGFVDIAAAFQRACAQSMLPRIDVTHNQGYPPSRLPPYMSPSLSANWAVAEYIRKSLKRTERILVLWMRQSSQMETQFINRDLSEKMLISEIKMKNVGFVDIVAAFQRVCAPSKVTPHRGYPSSRLPTIKFAPHPCHPASVQIGYSQSRLGSP